MSKTQRPLAEAEEIASAISADLSPACTRIEVAGSVRRRKETVGDVELVAIPRYEAAGLFGDRTTNLLWTHLHEQEGYRFLKGKATIPTAATTSWPCPPASRSISSWPSPTPGA